MTEQLAFAWTPRAEQAWLDAQTAGLNLDAIPRQVTEAEPAAPRSPLGTFAGARLEVKKIAYYMPFTEQQLLEQREFEEGVAAFNALPPEEQARLRAEAAKRRAAEKLARTCVHCGCDPDEHGGY